MRGPHPIALAFFDAHDVELLKATSATTSATAAASPPESRTVLARARGSLGWRTRHSSSSMYPVSILPVAGRRMGRAEVEGGASASFRVRQVFPGGSGGGRSRRREGFDVGDVVDSRHPPRDDDDDDANDDDANEDDDDDAAICEDDCEFGTGATVWPGSIVLLKYLERMAHDPSRINVLMGKTVADLGSGTAITSIASALLGADVVVSTDGCDPVVELARRNIHDAISTLGGEGDAHRPMHRRCSFRGCEMIARRYLWGEGMAEEEGGVDCFPTNDLIRDDDGNSAMRDDRYHSKSMDGEARGDATTRFDIILGADCIVPKLYPIGPLVEAIDELSAPTTVSYLSYEHRHYEHYDPAEEFRRLAYLRNLDVEVVPDSEMHPMYPANDIEIWKVTRNGNPRADDGIRPTTKGMRRACSASGGRSNHSSLLVGENS